MKKWYKGEIKVLFDAEHILNSDIGIEMLALQDYVREHDVWTPIKDMIIGDMKETDEKVEE